MYLFSKKNVQNGDHTVTKLGVA